MRVRHGDAGDAIAFPKFKTVIVQFLSNLGETRSAQFTLGKN